MTSLLEDLLAYAFSEKVRQCLSTILFDPSMAGEQKGRVEYQQRPSPTLIP